VKPSEDIRWSEEYLSRADREGSIPPLPAKTDMLEGKNKTIRKWGKRQSYNTAILCNPSVPAIIEN
jgi:hypothetical protein